MCVRRWVREEICVNSIFMKENPTVSWLGRMGGGHTHTRSRTVIGNEGGRIEDVAVGEPN